MLVDNVDIKSFGATLLNKDVQLANIEEATIWLKQAHIPIKINEKTSFRKVSLEILIEGNSFNDAIKKCSLLLDKVKDCSVKFEDLEGEHRLFLASHKEVKGVSGTKYRLFIETIGYYVGCLNTESSSRVFSKTINISGNLETPAIVEITPSIDIIDIVINGVSDDPMIIKNLKAGKKIIINGEDGTVLENGINKFNDTEMWEFPRLRPGSNTISFSKNNCDITIKYKPRWI